MKVSNQTQEFVSESYRYVSSYLDLPSKDIAVILDHLNDKILNKDLIEKILDVGCGNGESLDLYKKNFSASFAVGIEPSKDAVKVLQKKYKNNKEIIFQSAFAHNLPYDVDSFDLVTVWSVLHWIGRNEYLQSIGELIRVCKKYLFVMDFVASKDYRVPYSHKKGLYSYKQNFDTIISASGVMKPIKELLWWVNPNNKKIEYISKSQLEMFEKNYLSYHARKLVIYEKNYDLLPSRTENDFPLM